MNEGGVTIEVLISIMEQKLSEIRVNLLKANLTEDQIWYYVNMLEDLDFIQLDPTIPQLERLEDLRARYLKLLTMYLV